MTASATARPNKARVGIIAALTAGALNLKAVGGMLLKGGWIFKTGLSMLLSLAAYGFVYGWRFALVFICMLLIHEFGHWVWLKANRLPAEVPIFVPFVGAIISLKKLPEEETTTAWTALAGPLIGGAGALICWGIGVHFNNGPLMAGGSVGFFLNLLQLVPAMPLDGGWVLASISKKLLIPGTIILVLLAILLRSPVLVIISIIAIAHLFSKKKPKQEELSVPQTILDYERQLTGAASSSAQAQTNEGGSKVSGEKTRSPRCDFHRLTISIAYLLLTGSLGFMGVKSIAVLNSRLHISNPAAYLKVKTQVNPFLPQQK